MNNVDSPMFTCVGHKWKLRIHPGGRDDDRGQEGIGAAYLVSMNSRKVVVDFEILVKKNNSSGLFHNKMTCHPGVSDGAFYAENDMIGYSRLFRRDVVVLQRNGALKNGSLCLVVYIRVDPQYCLAEVKRQPT